MTHDNESGQHHYSFRDMLDLAKKYNVKLETMRTILEGKRKSFEDDDATTNEYLERLSKQADEYKTLLKRLEEEKNNKDFFDSLNDRLLKLQRIHEYTRDIRKQAYEDEQLEDKIEHDNEQLRRQVRARIQQRFSEQEHEERVNKDKQQDISTTHHRANVSSTRQLSTDENTHDDTSDYLEPQQDTLSSTSVNKNDRGSSESET